jgi:hypothetical protein
MFRRDERIGEATVKRSRCGRGYRLEDFTPYRALTMSTGASIHLAVGSDNSLCGFDDEFGCGPFMSEYPAPARSSRRLLPTIDRAALDFSRATRNVQYPFQGVTRVATPA